MKLILLLTSILLNNLIASDTNYSIIIDKKFDNQLFDIKQDYDRDLTAVGFTKKYITALPKNSYTDAFEYLSSIGGGSGTQMQLIKINASGNIIIDKSHTLSKFSEAVAVAKTPTNGYYVGGHTMNGQLILIKLDSFANPIFKKTFGTKNFDRLYNILRLSDGGVLVIGSSTTSRSTHDPIFKTGLGLNDMFLTRFSKDGETLWSKKYGTQHDDKAVDAIEAYDGSIIILGTTQYENNTHITTMRIDEDGNKIWLNHDKELKDITPHKIIRLRDNNFLLSLSVIDDMNKEQIRLVKFDLQGNIIIDKTLHTKYPSVLKDIKEYSDGGIIGVGYVKDLYNTDALVVMLDSRLNQLYQEHFGNDNFDVFNALTIMHNSQVACAGVSTNNDSQESNMWILKLNKDLSVAQKATNTNDVYELLISLYKADIKNKTIKIKKDLTIELVDKRLYFDVSKYKLTKTQEIFLEKFSKKLLEFLKKHQNVLNTLEVNGHTSSEWGKNSFEDGYIKNNELSMQRAFSALKFIFNAQDKPTKLWLSKILRGSGYSYSKKITLNDVENKEKSRRVSFKIILNETK